MNKLVIICGSLARGGAERVSIYLSKYMVNNGIKTSILTGERVENEYEPFQGVERICLTDNVCNKSKFRKLFYQIRNLHYYIEKNNIDTVLIMGVPLCIYAILGCIGTDANIIVSERNDPEHFSGKKIVKIVSRFFMRLAKGYVFQTTQAKEFYKNIVHKEGIVIPNPLLANNLPVPFNGKRDDVIVTAGRLNSQKNQKLLIDAFSFIADTYPHYKLIIYGEGILREELINRTIELGINNQVLFPGNVPDLLVKIQSASLFVMTSDFEGMPNALIEAMAIGLPCISTDCPCGGPRELIENGKNGLLIPVGDIEELIKAIRKILDNKEFALKLGQEAQNIRISLDMNIVGKQWLEYLNSL